MDKLYKPFSFFVIIAIIRWLLVLALSCCGGRYSLPQRCYTYIVQAATNKKQKQEEGRGHIIMMYANNAVMLQQQENGNNKKQEPSSRANKRPELRPKIHPVILLPD